MPLWLCIDVRLLPAERAGAHGLLDSDGSQQPVSAQQGHLQGVVGSALPDVRCSRISGVIHVVH